jgi:hypothetical protein
MKPLTIKSLNAALARSVKKFAASRHSADAERTARLMQFKNLLLAREHSKDTHDWMGPEDFARQQDTAE